MDENQEWFFMKHDDGSIFGPISFNQLRQWAEDAQISPLDKVSLDESTWIKAPMVPELGMDYLVEVSSDQYYGPTTLGAIREFLIIGEITPEKSPDQLQGRHPAAGRRFPRASAPPRGGAARPHQHPPIPPEAHPRAGGGPHG